MLTTMLTSLCIHRINDNFLVHFSPCVQQTFFIIVNNTMKTSLLPRSG